MNSEFKPHSEKIAIVGLGYVGLPLAVEFGKKRDVLGFDINARRVAQLKEGVDVTRETDGDELAGATHLSYTTDPEDLRGCGVFIVTVPTPVDSHHKPDLRPLLSASAMLGSYIQPGSLIIYESTTYPGCTEEDCVPEIERSSGLQFNNDFFVGYSPERINPGDKQRRLPNIVKVTSGSTPEVAKYVDRLYGEIINAGTHLAPTIRVAEASKIIENTQRDLNISLMNELSLIFARMGVNTLDVLEAAGTKWNFLPFRPGLVGGHCIGVDPYYLLDKAEKLGYIPQVILSGRRINDNMGRYVARTTIKSMIRNGIDVSRSSVGVLGLTFKEDCPDIRNSKVIDVIRELQDFGVNVVVEDPHANAEEVASEYDGVRLSKIEAQVDALIIAVAHREFTLLSIDDLCAKLRGERPVVADLKGIFDQDLLELNGATVWRL